MYEPPEPKNDFGLVVYVDGKRGFELDCSRITVPYQREKGSMGLAQAFEEWEGLEIITSPGEVDYHEYVAEVAA
jgi:hypothetical protein